VSVVVSLGEEAPAPAIEYRWDADTEILTGTITRGEAGSGLTGSVEIEGSEGAWITLDVKGGELAGVEVSVWPDVAIAPSLQPPANVSSARLTIPSRPSQPGIAAVEVETHLTARADQAERMVHFTLGKPRVATTVRAATDLLIELDDIRQVVGLWLLNVPPFPGAA
jgi:hypothetical protein